MNRPKRKYILTALLAGLLLLFTLSFIVAWASLVSFPSFEAWHRGGAGLHAGMTETEVVLQLKTRSRKVSRYTDEYLFYMYAPGGLARWSIQSLTDSLFTFPDNYRVSLMSFDSNGKLKSWEMDRMID